MNIHSEEILYQSPNIEIIEIFVEKGFATSEDDDPSITNPDMGWGN
jgi:hypothetical protein